MKLLAYIFIFFSSLSYTNSQFYDGPRDSVRWCAIGEFELKKCHDFATAVKATSRFNMRLECILVWSKDECLNKLDNFEADLVTLDPGEVFIGSRYHSLIPIMTEKYGPGAESSYYAIAVVNRTSPIRSIYDLKDKTACFPGVGQMAGWVYPIAHLLNRQIMPITDCNNHLKSAADFFGGTCAPNALNDKNNPTGDNPLKLCERCGVDHQTKCTDSDKFSGFGGAFQCLLGNRGDIAFVKHTTLEIMARNPGLKINMNDYELVCPNSPQRAPISQFRNCNWGQVPAHAIVTSSETSQEKIRRFQEFVLLAVNMFGSTTRSPLTPPGRQFGPVTTTTRSPQSPYGFSLFDSAERYGSNYNLMFQEDTTVVEPIEFAKQTAKDYLDRYEDIILQLRQCPLESVKFCVVSYIEMKKCVQMRTAMKAQFLKPELVCFLGRSQRDCMASVAAGNADLTMLDAGDVYTAGKHFGLKPILAEQYNLEGPYFYAVAVAKIEDPDTDLLFVRGKYSCHTGMGHGAGWIMPVSFLGQNSRLRPWGCDGPRAASEFFQKSCVPGGMSAEYNSGWKQNNLCDLCHGRSEHVCQRDHSEDFYGYTGAYRCLVEGGGNVAFIKHTTVFEISNGNNKMWWARNLLSEDYELLCRDGSRKPIEQYEECNLGKVPGNAMVTRRGNDTVIQYYVNLFLYAQEFYGSKSDEEQFKFQMFRTEFPYSDVIFQDAARQLVPIPPEQQNYLDYLGFDFVRAKIAVDCTAGASTATLAISLATSIVLLYALVS